MVMTLWNCTVTLWDFSNQAHTPRDLKAWLTLARLVKHRQQRVNQTLPYVYYRAAAQQTGTNLCVQGVYGILVDVIASYDCQFFKPRQLEPGQKKK